MKKQSKKTITRIKLKEWRELVLERDNYTCQISKEYLKDSPHNCQVHHILDRRNYPELKFDVMNGITLSYPNHKNSKKCPHLNPLFFVEWLKNYKTEQYYYLMNRMVGKVEM